MIAETSTVVHLKNANADARFSNRIGGRQKEGWRQKRKTKNVIKENELCLP